MMNYLFIAGASILFGSQFIFNQKYTKANGSALPAVMLFIISTSAIGFIYQFIVNGFRLDITPFSSICAVVLAALWISSSYVGCKSLECINVSAYSVFLMLGGMCVPSVYGIFFLKEELTVFKLLCFIFSVISILLTIDFSQKSGKKIYYLIAFLLNGIVTVCTYLHENATAYPTVNSSSYLMLAQIITVAASLLICIPACRKAQIKPSGVMTKKCLLYAMAYAACNNFANLMSMASMKHLPASVQSSLVTSGVLFVSLIFSIIRRENVSRKNILATITAVIATIMFAL